MGRNRFHLISIVTLLLFSSFGCKKPVIDENPYYFKDEWNYATKTTLEEAELKLPYNINKDMDPIIASAMKEQWVKFIGKMQPGDELAEFRCFGGTQFVHGYCGYEIIRKNKIIDMYIICM